MYCKEFALNCWNYYSRNWDILVFKCYFCPNLQTSVLFDLEKDFFWLETIQRRKKPHPVTCWWPCTWLPETPQSEGQWWGCWKPFGRVVSNLRFQLSCVKLGDYMTSGDWEVRIQPLLWFLFHSLCSSFSMDHTISSSHKFFFLKWRAVSAPWRLFTRNHMLLASHLFFEKHRRKDTFAWPGGRCLAVASSLAGNQTLHKRCFCENQIMSSRDWHACLLFILIRSFWVSSVLKLSRGRVSHCHRSTPGLSWRFGKKVGH